jgi:hypothetical protein
MTKCAVMQPTYFPWAGYYHLIDIVDVFVFLDDAQYERGTWQNRNRVLLNGQSHWLTVPARRQFLGQAINQITVDDKQNWRLKHIKLLSNAYAKHPYAKEMLEAVVNVLDCETDNLSELNIRIISEISRSMGITTRMLRSSDLGICGGRTEKLIRICEYVDCDEYISPVGSAAYLADDGFVDKTKIKLSFSSYFPFPYPQLKVSGFISHLSVLDIIANLGVGGACKYIRAL